MRNLSDIEIIESVKRGNQADFSLIVDRYKDKGFSLLKRMLRNDFDAEEVLQDSFLKAYQSLSSFRQDSKFSTWFYRIAYNSALTFLSSKRRRNEKELSSLEDHLELKDSDNEVYAESENVAQFVNKMIDKLPGKYSSIINMFYIDDMSLDEISKTTGLSLVNVKVILHRSRNALRDLVLKHNYHEELL
ncbi:MAG: sigma-70 family RNA polymerase sigma factor [Ignavibacteria bacterium]|jgi:RNA polymerase sigma-70 factor (ECF subfamily)|nr:sigma-70 family RNA polymerase sigma factor [Ignavibacteria bacterium]MCU7522165.1 sigma-70 family RNA polymerase sigma factor [Ignavibacteria bacterium]